MDPGLRFEISQVEALQQDKNDKEGQNKIYDGSGIMLKTMIQSPMGGERVEQVIFNIPSTMAYFPKLTAWELRERKGGGPPPMMIFDGFDPLLTDTLSLSDGLIGMKHPKRFLDSFGRAKPFDIPELGQPPRLVPKARFHVCKETLRLPWTRE